MSDEICHMKYVRNNWLLRTGLKHGDEIVTTNPLALRDKIIYLPLHIKLGLMKQFFKALNKEGKCFEYFFHIFTLCSH